MLFGKQTHCTYMSTKKKSSLYVQKTLKGLDVLNEKGNMEKSEKCFSSVISSHVREEKKKWQVLAILISHFKLSAAQTRKVVNFSPISLAPSSLSANSLKTNTVLKTWYLLSNNPPENNHFGTNMENEVSFKHLNFKWGSQFFSIKIIIMYVSFIDETYLEFLLEMLD